MPNEQPSGLKTRLLGTAGFAAGEALLNGACTQYAASRLHYHPALGTPLIGHLYQPFAWYGWAHHYYAFAEQTYQRAGLGAALGTLGLMLGYKLFVGLRMRSARPHSDVHGSARFATFDDLRKTGLIPPPGEPGRGVFCGAYPHPKRNGLAYLRHDGPEHICLFAPTRSGKGVGPIAMTLLSWPASLFVLDIKDENYHMSAGWRKAEAGNIILRYDPANPEGSCSWNPLTEIRFGTRFQVSDTQNIALGIVDSDGRGIERDHFKSAAHELLTGLILHLLHKAQVVGRAPGLYDCAQALTGVGDFATPDTENDLAVSADGDPRALGKLFAEMRDVALDRNDPAAAEARLVIAGVGRRMLNTPAKELGSIVSTANNALSLYRDPIVGGNTTRVDFKVADLMDHDKPVSLYFVTTPRDLIRMRPLIRLLVTQMISGLADRMGFDEQGRVRKPHKHRLLMVLDEFPTLGKLEVFEKALAFIAGYGIKALIVVQDIQQLYKEYTTYESIISNCHIRLAFAPNKVETAEWMSKMAGQATVVKKQITESGKRFGGVLESVSTTYQEIQRPLMTVSEIAELPGPVKDANDRIVEAGEMLIFAAGHPVIRGRQLLYFKDPVFSRRVMIRPPGHSERVRKEAAAATPALAAAARAATDMPPRRFSLS